MKGEIKMKTENESTLKDVYEELKKYFENDEEKIEEIKKISKEQEYQEICEESYNELIEEYSKKYNELKNEKRNIQKQEIKNMQKEKLASYCKSHYHIEISINKEDVTEKEKEVDEKLDEIEKTFKMLKGESELGEGPLKEIKYLNFFLKIKNT